MASSRSATHGSARLPAGGLRRGTAVGPDDRAPTVITHGPASASKASAAVMRSLRRSGEVGLSMITVRAEGRRAACGGGGGFAPCQRSRTPSRRRSTRSSEPHWRFRDTWRRRWWSSRPDPSVPHPSAVGRTLLRSTRTDGRHHPRASAAARGSRQSDLRHVPRWTVVAPASASQM